MCIKAKKNKDKYWGKNKENNNTTYPKKIGYRILA